MTTLEQLQGDTTRPQFDDVESFVENQKLQLTDYIQNPIVDEQCDERIRDLLCDLRKPQQDGINPEDLALFISVTISDHFKFDTSVYEQQDERSKYNERSELFGSVLLAGEAIVNMTKYYKRELTFSQQAAGYVVDLIGCYGATTPDDLLAQVASQRQHTENAA